MSMKEYRQVQPGMSEEKLRETYGVPDFMTQKDDGLTIYIYIERFIVGSSRPVEERRYYYYIRDQKVVAKNVRYYNAPANEAFDPDGYNL